MSNPNIAELGKATRFTSDQINGKPHTQKGPYLLPFLKKCLTKKINYADPETQKIIRGRVKDAVVWRLILNATEGDSKAIQDIFDRIDGKVTQKVESEIKVTQMGQVTKDDTPLKFDVGSNDRVN